MMFKTTLSLFLFTTLLTQVNAQEIKPNPVQNTIKSAKKIAEEIDDDNASKAIEKVDVEKEVVTEKVLSKYELKQKIKESKQRVDKEKNKLDIEKIKINEAKQKVISAENELDLAKAGLKRVELDYKNFKLKEKSIVDDLKLKLKALKKNN